MSSPTLSVITAVYNARETIEATIASVLGQRYPHVEFIVVDGASDDGTRELLEQYRSRFDVFVSEPDRGLYDALNKGISRASGEVIGFLHADDLFASIHTLENIAAAFGDTAVDAVYGDLIYVSRRHPEQTVRYWKAGEYSRRKLAHGWMPPHPTFYVRRAVYERLGGFDTGYRIAADYDCMLRFLSQGGVSCRYLPEVLVRMRLGGESNRSVRNILTKSQEDYRALKRNDVGGMAALMMKNFSKLPQFFLR